jgi:hypothetical protein
MVRTSVPCSRRWTANACRSECGVMGLGMWQRARAFWHACSTASLLMCCSNRSPGKSQCGGFSKRHQSRRMAKQFGREHHVAILHSFALLDAQDHALAINGRGSQTNRFGDAQAGCITRCLVLATAPRNCITSSGLRTIGSFCGFLGAGMISSRAQFFLRVTL